MKIITFLYEANSGFSKLDHMYTHFSFCLFYYSFTSGWTFFFLLYCITLLLIKITNSSWLIWNQIAMQNIYIQCFSYFKKDLAKAFIIQHGGGKLS